MDDFQKDVQMFLLHLMYKLLASCYMNDFNVQWAFK
jgi:hypothetical protein